jgi:mannose-1-phosphate guanylyltransferase/mannose-1-phosphate guanylyltransferase/mannose-6-phosphate isomerase
MIQADGRIVPVILAGGTGAGLWPISRESRPKQLLSLHGQHTLVQQAALRVADPLLFAGPMLIANAEHRFDLGAQIQAAGISNALIALEPLGRGTAPAVTIAALLASRADPDAVILVMPVDQWVGDDAAFRGSVLTGLSAARQHRFVQFLPCEATDAATYEGSQTEHNGILLLPAQSFLDELESRVPEMLVACRAALAGAKRDLDFLRLDEAAFRSCPLMSIRDLVAGMADRLTVVTASFECTEIGSWAALWRLADRDQAGNAVVGDVVLDAASGCYVRGEGQLVAAIGVDNLVITAMPDVVLVTRRDHEHDIGKLVERLKANGHRSATQTLSVHRPWGHYRSIDAGDRFQVKRITVKPGAKLSLQKHFHRAEHWVVVNGTAIVTRDDEEMLLHENESVFVPAGCIHRLENPGKISLNLIEVQSGAYLDEDDIVRLQDVYRRS